MPIQKAWQILDEYLTTTRYAVRDPESGRPLEKDYQEILERRLIPGLMERVQEGRDLLGGDYLLELCSALKQRLLIPATPFLMSFGNPYTRRPGYFSCYPLGRLEDDLESIDAMRRKMRTIYMAGGGAGIDLSKLRPRGAGVDSGQGTASGPVGFLPDFDAVTGTTNQGGRRRGALLVQLDWNHPDIAEYIKAKNFTARLSKFIRTLPPEERPEQNPHLSNMNISVNVFGDFWEKPDLIRLIAQNMWASGDPGLLFVDNMLAYSPLRAEDEPRYSNPCGEYLASAGSACNLVTVNAAKIARAAFEQLRAEGWESGGSEWAEKFNRLFWPRLSRTAGLAVYLGNLILDFDEGYPLPEIREATKRLKPVGVGMSGFHTALILAYYGEAVYGDRTSLEFARTSQAFLTLGTLEVSAEIARATGHVYENRPYWSRHLKELAETLANSPAAAEAQAALDLVGQHLEKQGGFYNCLTTSQAPTGSVSVFLRNLDTGIEPYFALEVGRRVRDSQKGWREFTLKPAELDDLLNQDDGFKERLAAQTALRLSPLEQLSMLAAFQYHGHTGVSKTVNLPASATVEDIEELIGKSRELRLKGFTVYRDGSQDGVLSVGTGEEAVPANLPDIGEDRQSRTFTAKSANLTAHITLTHDEHNNIREVFVSAGDVGASINSVFAALGMVLSASLREAPGLFDRLVKALCKVRMGERVVAKTKLSPHPIVGDSLPHVIGRLMTLHRGHLKGDLETADSPALDRGGCDLCPECHELSLHREGSCRKCDKCGFSTC